MEEHHNRVPPIPFSKLPLAATPSRAESVKSKLLPDPPDPDLARISTISESTRNDVGPLDIAYLDLVFKFQLLLKKTRYWAALSPQSKKSIVFSSLQTALVDLRVWAYDLSDGADDFLENLRNLASRNDDLNARLQRILGNTVTFLCRLMMKRTMKERLGRGSWHSFCGARVAHRSLESKSLNNC